MYQVHGEKIETSEEKPAKLLELSRVAYLSRLSYQHAMKTRKCLLLFLGISLAVQHAKAAKTCGEEEYQCLSSDCIPKSELCDGKPKCPNGDDENPEWCGEIFTNLFLTKQIESSHHSRRVICRSQEVPRQQSKLLYVSQWQNVHRSSSEVQWQRRLF